jgi:hypothetical protein
LRDRNDHVWKQINERRKLEAGGLGIRSSCIPGEFFFYELSKIKSLFTKKYPAFVIIDVHHAIAALHLREDIIIVTRQASCVIALIPLHAMY